MLLSSEIDWLSSFNSAALFDGCHSQILFYFETIIKMHVCLWISMRLIVFSPSFMHCFEIFFAACSNAWARTYMQKVHSGCRTANDVPDLFLRQITTSTSPDRVTSINLAHGSVHAISRADFEAIEAR